MYSDLFKLVPLTSSETASDNEKMIVDHVLTYVGSDLYPYRMYLLLGNRTEEAAVIEECRNSIFSMRNGYKQTNPSYEIISDTLSKIKCVLEETRGRLKGNVLILNGVSEIEMFRYAIEQLASLAYFFKHAR